MNEAKHTPGLEPFSDAPSLHREVVLLRDINKDLLEALEALMAYDKDGTFCRVDSVERYETITAKAEAAIRKAKAEGK